DIDAIGEQDLTASVRKLTEIATTTMGVARVGVWQFTNDGSLIVCTDLFDAGAKEHLSGESFEASDGKPYFDALKESNLIATGELADRPDLEAILERYTAPRGITALMASPIHHAGRVVGLICCEHIGDERTWTADEKTFAIAIANMVSLAMEGWQRRRTELALRNSLKELSDFRAALDEHAIVSIADASGKITFANEKFCEISKYTLEELL